MPAAAALGSRAAAAVEGDRPFGVLILEQVGEVVERVVRVKPKRAFESFDRTISFAFKLARSSQEDCRSTSHLGLDHSRLKQRAQGLGITALKPQDIARGKAQRPSPCIWRPRPPTPKPLQVTRNVSRRSQEACTSHGHPHKLGRLRIQVLTTLDAIRKKAGGSRPEQYLIAEQHYRTLLKQEAILDDVINLGALLRSQGRLKEGSVFYQQWINHFGPDERLLVNACNCWNDHNDAQLVHDQLTPLLVKNKLSRRLKLCLADSLLRLNRFQECITLLGQCLRENSKQKEILLSLGLAHSKNKNLPEALKAFTEASQIDPKDLEMVANRITILKDLGQFDQAEGLINQLSRTQQLQTDVAQATAGLLMAQNKLVEATILYQKFVKKDHAQLAIGSIGLQHLADCGGPLRLIASCKEACALIQTNQIYRGTHLLVRDAQTKVRTLP